MADNKYSRRDDIGDADFWDLRKNAPSSPSPRYPIHKKTDTSGVLIEDTSTRKEGADKPYKIPEKKEGFSSPDTIIEYTPENIFINKVKITTSERDKSIFNTSALFMRERAALIGKVGTPCDYVSFYAHSPRYSSMTRPQLAYYLWWRENIRRGTLIKTDISYIKLYVQEIVTAKDDEDIKKGLSDLISIARACFDNPVGKVYMARIISDFCLMHKMECPTEDIADMLPHFIFEHIADEFFLSLCDSNRKIYAPIAINHISIYNYKKSKFYTDENRAVFDGHISAAMHFCLCDDAAYREIAKCASGIFSTKLSDRRLFDGRVEFCAPSARILVSYYPISCISGVITDTVRYCENKLRALLGIKTSLAIGALPEAVTDACNRYFAAVAHTISPTYQAKQKATAPKAEEYDRLYDIPARALSLSTAKEIEERSWETTKRLTEAFADTPETPEAFVSMADMPTEPMQTEHKGVTFADSTAEKAEESGAMGSAESPWGEYLEPLLIFKNGTAAEARAYAHARGESIDELADKINELAVSLYGDIILDFDGDGYTVIEDYSDLI